MEGILNKIRSAFHAAEGLLGSIALFVIGWIIAFDTIGGCVIPIAFGRGYWWLSVINLLVDSSVIAVFVHYIIKQRHENID